MSTKSPRAAVTLPRGVHKVTARGREYFYFQEGRNTTHEGPRVSLPADPRSPEFWIALRKAQGTHAEAEQIKTINVVCDLYHEWLKTSHLTAGTKKQYVGARGDGGSMKIVRKAWGTLAADGLQPVHVQALMDELIATPGAANNHLGFLKALSKWGRKRGHFPHSITEGISPYPTKGGHKPWTILQQRAAELGLTGALRRAYFLARWTGQRGSDVIKLGETYVDEGGFRLIQQKNGKAQGDIWCPIEPPLEAEMTSWPREPGPYLRQANGKPYSKDLLEKHWREAVADIPALQVVTFHGLRATRVVELRQRGYSTLQIQDQVGMSVRMIDRYCRFADKKANGKAAVIELAERRHLQEGK